MQTAAGLDNGEWHRLDVFWDRERVRLLVDLCAAAQVVEMENGTEPVVFHNGTCAADGVIPPFNEYLNVNAPLQLGGVAHAPFGQQAYGWQHRPNGKPFDGCIRNLVVNSEVSSCGGGGGWLGGGGLSSRRGAVKPRDLSVCWCALVISWLIVGRRG